MVFVKHNGRKDRGRTSTSKMIRCYKCGKEIEIGEVFYTKISHSKWGCKHKGYSCVSCYESLFINI